MIRVKLKVAVTSILFASAVTVPNADAQTQDCDSVLVKELTISTMKRVQQLSWLKLATHEDFKEKSSKFDLSGVYEGITGALSKNDYETAKSKLLTKEKFTYDDDDTRSFLRTGITEDQSKTWLACKALNVPGVYMVVANVSSDTAATLSVMYRSAPGRMAKITVDATGGTINKKNRFTINMTSGAVTATTIARKGTQRMIFTANASTEEGPENASTTTLPVPYLPPVIDPVTTCATPVLLSRNAQTTANRYTLDSHKVTDGNPTSLWNSLAYSHHPVWIELTLPSTSIVTRVELNPEQTDAYPQVTEMWGIRANGDLANFPAYSGIAQSGTIQTINVGQQLGIKGLRVQPSQWAGAIAFREIEVFGCVQ